ncbi:MAG: hypothetical protein NUV80_01980 [Candidatus Berkelbacteria bacterium]|nr:hypothetical protein [Candidatus Berkelbacteria bacterium]
MNITSPTLINTIEMALETSEIIINILADRKLTYKEKYDLIDDILASTQTRKDME